MKIAPINFNTNFNGARINILPSSDNHGDIHNLPDYLNTIESNQNDIFCASGKNSTLNLYINAGDLFTNPLKRGFLSSPDKTNGDVQKDFYCAFVQCIKKIVKKDSESANFKALYTPGNHCYSAGDRALYGLLSNFCDLDVVLTNVDLDKSSGFSWLINEKNPKFFIEREFEIKDDKDEDRHHHLLVLGATIPSMEFYNPGLLKDTVLSDTNSKKDINLDRDDISGTICAIKTRVDKFKRENPNGIVVLSSHLGTRLVEALNNEVQGIDVILDAHDHKLETNQIDNTTLVSLGADNNIVKSIALLLDDEGKIKKKENRTYSIKDYSLSNSLIKNNALKEKLTTDYARDNSPLIKMANPDLGDGILNYSLRARYSNSILANFLTSAIKEVLNLQDDVDTIGMQSSMLRGGLKDGSSNFDILRVFDGASELLSGIYVGEVTGEELLLIIMENVKQNLENPIRNTIIQWSDISINRRGLSFLKDKKGIDVKEGLPYINIRNGEGLFEKINLGKTYKIALPEKYILKKDIVAAKAIERKFKPTSKTYFDLFKVYLENADYTIDVEPYLETRIFN